MPQTVASHVLATDLTVPGPEEWWRAVTSRAGDLRRLGAHHVVAYAALREPGRVFVTIGLRHREPLDRLLRSRAVFDWFDATGVEQIPPLFAGSVVEKIGVDLPGSEAGSAHPEAVVIAAILEVDDVELVRDSIHAQTDRFVAAGVRKVWLYRALDVGREVMLLQEVASVGQAERWLQQPQGSAEWLEPAGLGVYPPVFVGRLLSVLDLDLAPSAEE